MSLQNLKPESYLTEEAAWEFVVLIARQFRALLKEKIRQSPYFGIMVDETTDQSTIAQLIIYIKFMDKDPKGDLFVNIQYLDMVPPASGTASDITVSSASI